MSATSSDSWADMVDDLDHGAMIQLFSDIESGSEANHQVKITLRNTSALLGPSNTIQCGSQAWTLKPKLELEVDSNVQVTCSNPRA